MELSDGCLKIMIGVFIAAIILVFLVIPIAVFLADPQLVGWGVPLVFAGVFSYFVAMFLGFEDNKVFNITYNVYISFATLLLLRHLFLSDLRAGLELVLSIPLGVLVYFFVFEPLAKESSEVGRALLLKGLGILGNVIVNVLVFLILRFVIPIL